MKKLETEQPSPIKKLESWTTRSNFVDRQVGFCAQWALDNLCELYYTLLHVLLIL